jgi:hypothetical protein
MYTTKRDPTSEDEHRAEIEHFTNKIVWSRKKMSDHDRSELKTRMYAHPAKRHSPVGYN